MKNNKTYVNLLFISTLILSSRTYAHNLATITKKTDQYNRLITEITFDKTRNKAELNKDFNNNYNSLKLINKDEDNSYNIPTLYIDDILRIREIHINTDINLYFLIKKNSFNRTTSEILNKEIIIQLNKLPKNKTISVFVEGTKNNINEINLTEKIYGFGKHFVELLQKGNLTLNPSINEKDNNSIGIFAIKSSNKIVSNLSMLYVDKKNILTFNVNGVSINNSGYYILDRKYRKTLIKKSCSFETDYSNWINLDFLGYSNGNQIGIMKSIKDIKIIDKLNFTPFKNENEVTFNENLSSYSIINFLENTELPNSPLKINLGTHKIFAQEIGIFTNTILNLSIGENGKIGGLRGIGNNTDIRIGFESQLLIKIEGNIDYSKKYKIFSGFDNNINYLIEHIKLDKSYYEEQDMTAHMFVDQNNNNLYLSFIKTGQKIEPIPLKQTANYNIPESEQATIVSSIGSILYTADSPINKITFNKIRNKFILKKNFTGALITLESKDKNYNNPYKYLGNHFIRTTGFEIETNMAFYFPMNKRSTITREYYTTNLIGYNSKITGTEYSYFNITNGKNLSIFMENIEDISKPFNIRDGDKIRLFGNFNNILDFVEKDQN